MLSLQEKKWVEQVLAQELGEPTSVDAVIPVSGGDTHTAWRVEVEAGVFFLKAYAGPTPSSPFESEVNGLDLLRKHSSFCVPKVIATEPNTLLLEWLDAESGSVGDPDRFSSCLAELHRTTHGYFGLDHSNYIGQLPQLNTTADSWHLFYAAQRLEPQIKQAFDMGLLQGADLRSLEAILSRMEDWFPIEPPALIHGDLWSGNSLSLRTGEVALFDPAVYYGFREMDLAMMHLFGGFHPRVFQLYHEKFPLETGYEERIPLCQLYPLLVHVNLFGSTYVPAVRRVCKSYL